MADLKFTKATDQEHEIKLDSHLISASWLFGMVYTGQNAKFEIRTVFVGNGAKVKATGKSEKGKKLGKVKGEMLNNVFVGAFEIPEKIDLDDQVYFEVELPDNGLNGESAKVPVYPTPKIKSIKWSAAEARRGEVLTLSAELENVRDGADAKLVIYEFDQDGAHDKISELMATIKGSKIEEKWEYEYFEDTDELPTSEEILRYGGTYNPPEYFFVIKIGEQELGKAKQDSGLLQFKDWLEIKMLDNTGQEVCNVKYKVTLPDGSERKGSIGPQGFAREERIPPGRCLVEFEDSGGTQSST